MPRGLQKRQTEICDLFLAPLQSLLGQKPTRRDPWTPFRVSNAVKDRVSVCQLPFPSYLPLANHTAPFWTATLTANWGSQSEFPLLVWGGHVTQTSQSQCSWHPGTTIYLSRANQRPSLGGCAGEKPPLGSESGLRGSIGWKLCAASPLPVWRRLCDGGDNEAPNSDSPRSRSLEVSSFA